jgi:hypothetical protein
MPSRIDIGPSGGPYVELDESSGDFVIRIPNSVLDVDTARVINASAPQDETDLVTKSYADSLKEGLDVKDSVEAATTGDIDLTSSTDPNPVDGVTLTDGDRILLKDQTTASENGIYAAATATDPTTWTRTPDADGDDLTDGTFVWVNEGTTNADKGFILTTDDPITVGTTDLTFVQFSGAGQISAGTNLNKSGDTINLDATISLSAVDVSGQYTIGNQKLATEIVDSGQVSLASGSATVTTGITTTDATFYPAIGVDDPGADVTGLAAQLDFNSTSGEYELTVKETDSSQNPTVNYDIVRVR